MSITIEHDKRKREILEKALDVFVDEGYEDTTFQKIAERCGITRTILYLYFKNKREVFSFSIKLFTEKLEDEIKRIEADPALSQADKLYAIIAMVVEVCCSNRRLIAVVLAYLDHLKAAGGNPDERVRRRTIRLRHRLAGVIIQGQRSGEFGAFSVKSAGDLVYALFEAALFRIAVLGRDEAASLTDAARLLSTALRAPPKPAEGRARSRQSSSSAPPRAEGSGEVPASAPRRVVRAPRGGSGASSAATAGGSRGSARAVPRSGRAGRKAE